MKRALSLLLITISLLFLTSCSRNSFRFEYGVFIGAEAEDVDAMKDYRIIVVEGQLFDKDDDLAREIREFCEKNGYGYYISDSLELGA